VGGAGAGGDPLRLRGTAIAGGSPPARARGDIPRAGPGQGAGDRRGRVGRTPVERAVLPRRRCAGERHAVHHQRRSELLRRLLLPPTGGHPRRGDRAVEGGRAGPHGGGPPARPGPRDLVRRNGVGRGARPGGSRLPAQGPLMSRSRRRPGAIEDRRRDSARRRRVAVPGRSDRRAGTGAVARLRIHSHAPLQRVLSTVEALRRAVPGTGVVFMAPDGQGTRPSEPGWRTVIAGTAVGPDDPCPPLPPPRKGRGLPEPGFPKLHVPDGEEECESDPGTPEQGPR
jgi:hypothetical protein